MLLDLYDIYAKTTIGTSDVCYITTTQWGIQVHNTPDGLLVVHESFL